MRRARQTRHMGNRHRWQYGVLITRGVRTVAWDELRRARATVGAMPRGTALLARGRTLLLRAGAALGAHHQELITQQDG